MDPKTRELIAIACSFTGLLAVVLLLWVFEVIATPAFLGGVVVLAVAEGVVIMRWFTKARRAAQGGPSTADRPSAAGEQPSADGYDPMDKYR